MKRTLVVLLLVLSGVPLLGQSTVSITSITAGTVATLGSVTVNGSGFTPATAAISVIVVPQGGFVITVPVYSATASAVKFMMPPLISSSTGTLFDSPVNVDIQVVQATASSVSTSNVLSGLTVNPPPQSSATPGRLTRAFLQITGDLQETMRAATGSRYPSLSARSQTMSDDLRGMIDAVTAVIDNGERTVLLSTTNNVPAVLNRDALVVSDRVVFAMVTQLNQQLTALVADAPNGATRVRPLAEPCSQRAVGLPQVETEMLCGMGVQYDRINRIGGPLVASGAATVYGMPLALVGSQAVGSLAAAEVVGPHMAVALGLLPGPVASHLAAHATGSAPPTVGATFTDIGISLLESLAGLGVPIFSGTLSGINTAADFEAIANGPTGPAPAYPRQGVMISAPTQPVPVNTRPIALIPGTGIGGTARWLAVAATQQVTALTTVTQPPPSAARFNGLYTGSSNGSCTVTVPEGPPIVQSASGPLSLTIANGVMSVTAGGSGQGTVSPTGQLGVSSVASAGGACDVGGRFWEDPLGRAGGLGYTRCSGPGFTCAGTWNVLRR